MSVFPIDVSVSLVFSKDRALASGLSLFGLMSGLAMGPFITEVLLETFAWRGTVLLLAGLTMHRIPLGLTLWCPQDTTKASNKHQKLHCRSFLDLSLLTNRYFMLFCLASMGATFYIEPFMAHMASLAVSLGLSLREAAWLPTVIFMTCVVFSFIMSFVSNMVSSTHRVLICTGACMMGMVSVLVLVLVKGYKGALLASVFGGVHFGKHFDDANYNVDSDDDVNDNDDDNRGSVLGIW